LYLLISPYLTADLALSHFLLADFAGFPVKQDGDLVCRMSRGIKIMADVSIDEAAKQEWDCIALPGGMPGANHLRDSSPLMDLLEKQRGAGKVRSIKSAAMQV